MNGIERKKTYKMIKHKTFLIVIINKAKSVTDSGGTSLLKSESSRGAKAIL